MRKLILPLLLFSLSFVACKKKEWSKDYIVQKCNSDFKKKPEINQYFNDTQMKDLCNCVADKMIGKYKSQAEADKDEAGAEEIGADCARQVLQPNTDTPQ